MDKSSLNFDLDFPEGVVHFTFPRRDEPQLLWQLTEEIIPVADTLAEMGSSIAKDFGKAVACGAGCGVCCCQMVPLSPPEAAIIFDVVNRLPQNRKFEVCAAFSRALEALAQAGIKDALSEVYRVSADIATVREINRKYFELGISCPFLEKGSCSIYSRRPSRCREYSVMSSPELCANPFDNPVKRLPLTLKLSESLSHAWSSLTGKPPVIIPLVKALEWVEHNREVCTLSVCGAEHVVQGVLEFACAKANKSAARDLASHSEPENGRSPATQ
jgi:Fe-S-cluster containining protein